MKTSELVDFVTKTEEMVDLCDTLLRAMVSEAEAHFDWQRTLSLKQHAETVQAIRSFIQKHSDPNMVMVPREPTERMVRSGIDFVRKASPIGFAQTRCAEAYKAMIKAAKDE